MTQDKYVIRRKLNILELGETLVNISEACRKLGVSRQHHYDIKSARVVWIVLIPVVLVLQTPGKRILKAKIYF